MGAKAVGGQEDPVAVAGLWFADVDAAWDRRRQRRAVDRVRPHLRELRTAGPFGGAEPATASGQDVLPSAALGFSENPTGSVRFAALISDGEGKLGLSNCGTVRSMSTPEAESVAVVVGLALRLGLKLS